eukprot:TRINITY_DN962_c0_g1_i5.p1 TRINITY_DN962_c0_g1~~TRINITY_DN962_c0_g1_i5.p1  ORF type:complete len:1038 (-),score=234.06 TRINITY_DN962_c0_g1_i5:373-3441(-)
MWIFLFLAIQAQVIHGLAPKCDKTPIGQQPYRNQGDGGFLISVAGSPNLYRPGQTYNITLQGFRLQNGDIQPSQIKFIDFTLVAESELPATEVQDLGVFQLMQGDAMSKFSLDCSHAVKATSAVSKDEIHVLWTAPVAGSGCIQLKAMVVERKDLWFMDDDGLTYNFCEDNSPMETPPLVEPCCACDEAKYEVIFEGLWSRHTHPKDYPIDEWKTQFSDLIGASHSIDYDLWKYGEQSSPALSMLAESGKTKKLEIDMKTSSKHIRSVIKARGLQQRSNVISRTFAVFRMDPTNHLLSLVSKMIPSPDWIVGVSMENLCLSNCSWVDSRVIDLYPWDAGIWSGLGYHDTGAETMPRERIHRITACKPNSDLSPFYDNTCAPLKPVARIHIQKQREYKKQCPNNGQGGPGIPLNPSWGSSVAGEIDPGQGNIYTGTGIGPTSNQDTMDQYGGQAYNDHSSSYSSYGSYRNNDRCDTKPWTQWTPCSQTCGTGSQSRTREFVNEIGASINGCSKDDLFEKRTCQNPTPCPSKYYDPLYGEDEVGLAGYTSPWSRRGLSAQNLKKEESGGQPKSYVYPGANKPDGQDSYGSNGGGGNQAWLPNGAGAANNGGGAAMAGNGAGNQAWLNVYNEKYAGYTKQKGFPPASNKPGASNYNPYKAVGYYGYTYGGPPTGMYSNMQNTAYLNYAAGANGGNKISQIQGDSSRTNCDTEEWGDWSECSEACGRGKRSRSRIYISSNTGACSEDLFQSEDCEEYSGCVTPASLPSPQRRTRKRKGPFSKEDPQCAVAEWSDWSPCSVTCGQGYKLRTRVFTLSFVPNRVCEGVRLTEKQDCRSDPCPWNNYYEYDQPSYVKSLPRDMNMMDDDVDSQMPKEPYCSESPDPGICKSEFNRWYYSPSEETCKEYTYSGCGGNRNSFMSYESCMQTCHPTSSKSSFKDLTSMAMVRKDYMADDSGAWPPRAALQDCQVSEWSDWSECSADCGRGWMLKTREIVTMPQNGGRGCPRKMEKRRKCRGMNCANGSNPTY